MSGPESLTESPDGNAHQWVMVGYWHLTPEQIQTSFEEQQPLQLAQPDEVEGPGCLHCEVHWVVGKDTPCPVTTTS